MSAAFAVVGHPNKGKSSLVSTLAQDASVAVGTEPGTTIKARRFPMRLDGRTLYELIDTPGFQRPRAMLEWLEAQDVSAAERAATVARFVAAHEADPRFEAECELLRPITEGAGILYVVDGAVPYTPEYDAEMEILRWTGQPSIAVINTIGEGTFVADWTLALGQYFRIVRELDALDAPFDRRLAVLGAFGELAEGWREPMASAIDALTRAQQRARRQAGFAIAGMMDDAVRLTLERRIDPGDDVEPVRESLESRFRERLRDAERDCRERVEALYRHEAVERREDELALLDEDLFAEGTWLAFGLSRTDLAKAGATGGALAGLGVDAIAGGTSLFAGAAIGALVGGVTSWLSAGALAELEIQSLPLGGRVARYGPSRNANLPYVLLGRARAHHRLVAGRSHARRGPLEVQHQGERNVLGDDARNALARALKDLAGTEHGRTRHTTALGVLADAVESVLRDDEQQPAPGG